MGVPEWQGQQVDVDPDDLSPETIRDRLYPTSHVGDDDTDPASTSTASA